MKLDKLLVTQLAGIAALFVSLLVTGARCDDFPKDPQNTLERVRGGQLRVGVSEDRPWVWRDGKEARGVEADLVRELAKELDTQIEWVWASQDEHLAALEEWHLDLVIGGLTQSTPWRGRVALTRPFLTERVVVGVPQGVDQGPTFAGVAIAVPTGSLLASKVEEIEADPVATEDWWQAGPTLQMPAAVPEWALDPWEMTASGTELTKRRHVWAAPPGENGWLVHLERFLHKRQKEIEPRLQTAVRELAAKRGASTQPAAGGTR